VEGDKIDTLSGGGKFQVKFWGMFSTDKL
jgi:hypothetical protein